MRVLLPLLGGLVTHVLSAGAGRRGRGRAAVGAALVTGGGGRLPRHAGRHARGHADVPDVGAVHARLARLRERQRRAGRDDGDGEPQGGHAGHNAGNADLFMRPAGLGPAPARRGLGPRGIWPPGFTVLLKDTKELPVLGLKSRVKTGIWALDLS